MKSDVEKSLQKFQKAFTRLEHIALLPRTDIHPEATIQAFEFSFEACWKCLRLFLRENGTDANNPRATLKEAFRLNWITDEDAFLEMLEARNITSHDYDEEDVKQVYESILSKFVKALKLLLKKLLEVFEQLK